MTVEYRERVVDGELVTVTAEDKAAAEEMAAQMGSSLAGQPYLRVALALEILTCRVFGDMAGPEWAKALSAVFKQIPID